MLQTPHRSFGINSTASRSYRALTNPESIAEGREVSIKVNRTLLTLLILVFVRRRGPALLFQRMRNSVARYPSIRGADGLS
jgi:hypothetical protein